MFSPSKDKLDEVYASLQQDFNIDDDGEPNKYFRIDLDRLPYFSIRLSRPYLTQIIINMIPVIDKSSSAPTPAVKPPLEKN